MKTMYSRKHVLEAIQWWQSQLGKLCESEDDVDVVQLSFDSCQSLLQQIDAQKLFTVSHWEPERIFKTRGSACIYYAGYIGRKLLPQTCTAVIACQHNDPCPGFVYFDEMTGVKKGYGMKTLQAVISKASGLKLWWLSSPGYDEQTDSYYENKRLNSQYRKLKGLTEIRLEDTIWRCPASWFCTPSCKKCIEHLVVSQYTLNGNEDQQQR